MWFSHGNDSYGVKYCESFSTIPLPTLALLMALVSPDVSTGVQPCFLCLNEVDICLNEWKTGTLISNKLQESSLKAKFSGYLKNVVSWKELNPKVTGKI